MNILLTGASGGIGNSLLLSLLSAGHNVVATYHSANKSSLENKLQANWVKVDFADSKAVSTLLMSLNDIDIVVHCAGIAKSALIGKQDFASIQEQIAINLTSSILIIDELVPKMISKGFGRVVLFGSIVGRDGSIGLSTYAACKSALKGLVKSVAREIPSLNKRFEKTTDFTINLVSPGYTKTPMTNLIPKHVKDLIISRTAIGRFVDTSEIVRLVEFLISKESESICGVELEINGGSFL
jgi:NAD(P)-dependent dehydrogenase (short-subunit alcohol dehydrogenase family)